MQNSLLREILFLVKGVERQIAPYGLGARTLILAIPFNLVARLTVRPLFLGKDCILPGCPIVSI